uniref:Uncharacterized protein n=1 Tax=Ditylum brightwellii TaxID=49249 RepID=A0A7S2EK41_9STRA|mmetsp:Transcript_33702/g.50285  ORF Transcript_33702/g.50285 Transcript_33702/m.50285 type:complete len:666 (+) Transcript_33702:169-2166(+)
MAFLLSIDSSTFNILSDLIGKIGSFALIYAVGSFFNFLMTHHLKTRKTIPLEYLGVTPERIDQCLKFTKDSGVSLSTIALILLLLIAEFSHTVSDADLSFETVSLPSEEDIVLDMSPKSRNSAFLYQVVGEPPSNARSTIFAIDDNDGVGRNSQELVNAFLSAGDSIARGTSPFVLHPKGNRVETVDFLIYGVPFFVDQGDTNLNDDGESFLSRMKQKIPLNCASMEMKRISQKTLGVSDSSILSDVFEASSLLPNCDFSQLRKSGIYGDDHVPSTTVTDFATYIVGGKDSSKSQIKLRFSDGDSTEFFIPQVARKLARDREDWKEGRTISGINAIVHNGVSSVKLGKIVFSNAGAFVGPSITSDSLQGNSDEYMFVAEIEDECPQPPGVWYSGRRECLAIIDAVCEPFPEDTLIVPIDFAQSSLGMTFPSTNRCRVWKVHYLWGNGFGLPIEYTFLAAVAGVIARNNLLMSNLFQDTLIINAIPAAMFLLASLSMDLSQKEEVRPSVGYLWLFFILLPLVLGGIIFFFSCIFKSRSLPIPQNQWEFMIVGKEDEMLVIPKRDSKTDRFPKPEEHLRYGIVGYTQIGADKDGTPILGFLSKGEGRSHDLHLGKDRPPSPSAKNGGDEVGLPLPSAPPLFDANFSSADDGNAFSWNDEEVVAPRKK